MDVAISVRKVSKRYRVFEDQRSRLLNMVWPRHTSGMREVVALNDINFEIGRGEAVGIIGRNGSGKSTLLEILSGTLTPTSGDVRVHGRVSALLELGSGFNPEYTGRENVILNGLILGLSRVEVLARFEEIEAFAEIGSAIDRPVKTYSSGMMMRLAFAVQALCEPDILIVDEALSVGDFFFQQKCLGHIRALCEKGVTLLFVSHDMGTVRDICKRAIFLKDGQVHMDGETGTVIQRYMAMGCIASQHTNVEPTIHCDDSPSCEFLATLRDSLWQAPSVAASTSQPGRLVAVGFYDENRRPTTVFRLGSSLRIQVIYSPAEKMYTQITAVIMNKFNQVVTSIASSSLGVQLPARAGKLMMYELNVQLMIEAGNYSVQLRLGQIAGPNQGEPLDWTDWLGPVTVRWNYEAEKAPFLGMVGLPVTGSVRPIDANESKAIES